MACGVKTNYLQDIDLFHSPQMKPCKSADYFIKVNFHVVLDMEQDFIETQAKGTFSGEAYPRVTLEAAALIRKSVSICPRSAQLGMVTARDCNFYISSLVLLKTPHYETRTIMSTFPGALEAATLNKD